MTIVKLQESLRELVISIKNDYIVIPVDVKNEKTLYTSLYE